MKVVEYDGKTVVVESELNGNPDQPFANAITELQSADARRLAIAHATKEGMSGASCAIAGAPYPVTKKGDPIEAGGTAKIHRYRVDIPVNSAIR